MTRRTAEELETLALYGAKDFRSIGKDKLMEFTSTLHQMDPEVAKAVIDQIPGYFETCEKMTDAITTSFEKSLENGNKEYQAALDKLDAYRDYLFECHDKAQTDEARIAILNQISELMKEYTQIYKERCDKTSKEFNKTILSIIAVLGLAAAAMGIHSHFGKKLPLLRR